MYEKTIQHKGLGKFRIVRGRTPGELEVREREVEAAWREQWAKRQEAEMRRLQKESVEGDKQRNIAHAERRTAEAEAAIAEMESILQATFGHRYPDVWESMRDYSAFAKPCPAPPAKPVPPAIVYPEKPDRDLVPPKPSPDDLEFQPRFRTVDILNGWSQKRIEAERGEAARQRYEQALEAWRDRVRAFNKQAVEYNEARKKLKEEHDTTLRRFSQVYALDMRNYQLLLEKWEREKAEYESEIEKRDQLVVMAKVLYFERDPEAVQEYCGAILSRSKYPECCSQNFEMSYIPETKTLVVDYYFPKIEDIPALKSVKFNQSQNRFVETDLSESARNRLYEGATYQIALRTLHELFACDDSGALDSVVFNGVVETIDKSTGREIRPCILSVQVTKVEFQQIILTQVDPKACFRKLKGVSAAQLHTLTPIAPVAQINREDKRFVEAYGVTADLDDSVNLAAMDWEDFEHLIRELFAREFSGEGGEVRVTQTSRDGGVDAVAFDPDPIRGGKIVIQAKRYTNVVGVAAVRDLYGTVMNEGANKGILVTTSYYGSDAYEFARGKPLTLLDGGNLLSLLGKHGHKAKIDLQEAKKALASRLDQK